MTPDQAAALRQPFPADLIGKLPRIWCRSCRDARGKVCDQHNKARCSVCRNNISDAHLHLDYVGHAETTDRLLTVDPGWSWEPVAFGPDGLPVLDAHGGLWIRLTVAGVTRLGYGHAEGKEGPDAVKEAIGDAIRNAAMRFGVALDLWGAKFKDDTDEPAEPQRVNGHKPYPRRQELIASGMQAILAAESRDRLEAIGRQVTTFVENHEISEHDAIELRRNLVARLDMVDGPDVPIDPLRLKRLHTLFSKANITDRDDKLDYCSAILGRTVDSTKTLTANEADAVMDAITAGLAEPKEEVPA